jgi:hypothetical protein
VHPASVALLVAQLSFAPLPADSLPLTPRVPHPREVATGGVSAPVVNYSDAYYRRLDIHRKASTLTIPLFALQMVAGAQLFDKSVDAPEWAKVGHRIGATGVAALFATNLVTGVPNMIEGFKDPNDRGRRLFHASLMLAASAGFTATGLLAERAEGDPNARNLHRTIAYSSMGVATVAYFSMLDFFRGN